MSDLTNNKSATEQSATDKPIEPQSVTRDAGELMEDLFSDIDRVLEEDNNLANQLASSQSVSLPSIRISKSSPPEPLQQQAKKNTPKQGNLNSDRDSQSFDASFEKIIFVVACICFIASIFLFLNRDKFQFQSVQEPAPSSDKQLSESDAQFIAYMLQALKEIDRKKQAREEVATTVKPASTINSSPPPPTPATPAPIETPKVIERKVYIPIPVYPPTPKETVSLTPTEDPVDTPLEKKDTRLIPTPDLVTPTAPSPSPSPPPLSPQTVVTQPPPTPQAITPSPSPEPPSPSPSPQAVAPSPTVEVTPDPVKITPTPLPSPSVNRALIGLLELGDRSVALFDINGNTERISLGKEIGSSGWILDSVANGEITIRRNGNLRSLYPGQNF